MGSGPHRVDYGAAAAAAAAGTSQPTAGGGLKEVVVSRKCGEAVLRGAQGLARPWSAQVFVPGVLACSSHVEAGDMVAVSVAVEQLVPPKPSGAPDRSMAAVAEAGNGWSRAVFTRGTTLGSAHASAFEPGAAPTSDRRCWLIGVGIGVGRAVVSRTKMFRDSSGVAVEMLQRVFDLPPCHSLLPRLIFLQNLPSILAAYVLGKTRASPRPRERVLDMCAAPGGKTTAIAILMKDEGEVVALDRSHNKVINIRRLASEMGLNCIKAYKKDATKAVLQGDAVSGSPRSTAASLQQRQEAERGSAMLRREARRVEERLRRGIDVVAAAQRVQTHAGFAPRSFDRVLLDAPCSALGLRPRLFAGDGMVALDGHQCTLEELRMASMYQRRLLDQAVQLVAPGGTFVYSTCTINPGENEAVVRYALDKYHFLTLSPQEPSLGGPGLVGGEDVFDGVGYKRWLTSAERHLVQRFDPSHELDTIGFFIAKFTRLECNNL
eukprot:SM000008S22342  [mRNA]  locus=s8:1135794:1139339:- [translate_table: standard]